MLFLYLYQSNNKYIYYYTTNYSSRSLTLNVVKNSAYIVAINLYIWALKICVDPYDYYIYFYIANIGSTIYVNLSETLTDDSKKHKYASVFNLLISKYGRNALLINV